MNARVVLSSSLLAVCSALPGCSRDLAIAPAVAAQTVSAVRYRCPMHPAIQLDHPGDCPVCGMKLVAEASREAALTVAAEQQKVLGVVVGRVAPDETRVYRLNAGIDGSIREISRVTTGSRVRKDQVLATFWAPSALSVIQLFILNVAGKEYAVQRHTEGSVEGQGVGLGYANIQQRTMQLENMGVSPLQREELARTRKVPDTIQIVSPADGFVLARNVTADLKFDRGFELYRIADLRRVWILADVFPQDAPHVRPGMRARISIPGQAASLQAAVAEVLPQFDSSTRTLKVRLEADNPGFVLRPEMLVDVRFEVALAPALVVPADAVVDSGLARTVFVESAEGSFTPRAVETGWRNAGLVEIVEGLSPGERIVTSGTFFLDSESRMRATAPGAVAARTAAPAPTGHEGASSGGAGPHHPEAAPAGAGEQR